jgi:hypothetical protein
MKKVYVKPMMWVEEIENQDIICASTTVTEISGNADIEYGGGGSGPARARGFFGEDEDWDEE